MATLTATGHKVIVKNRRYEDYRSMKQHFSDRTIKEILFSGSQVMTEVSVVVDGSDHTIAAQLSAEAHVFLSTIADDATQDLKSVWVTYQDDTGLIVGPYEHVLNDTANTSVEAPLFNEDVIDTIAAGQGGKAITLTTLAGTLNQYAGKYMVAMDGDGVAEAGNLIVSNTAATPTILTVTNNSHAAANGDNISIQTYPGDDFYRAREMYCEQEVIDASTIRLGDHDSTNIYAGIGEGHRYMSNSGFFTQPAATCRSFLGRVRAQSSVDSTVTQVTGSRVTVFYTPLEAHANGGAVETQIDLDFADTLDWQPCIELETATDVVIKAMNIEGAKLPNMLVETSYLEVYPTNSTPSS